MKKVNIFSVFLFNLFRGLSKKYSSFFLMIVAILVYGFSFTFASASTNVDADITESTHWTLSGSPYIVTNDIYISSGVKLTIDKGVVVKFDYGYGLYLDGEIEALGTVDDKIYFTSYYDDTAGGDTDGSYEDCYYNEDENGIGEDICGIYDYSPEEGDWAEIEALSSTAKLTLNNVVNKYSSGGLLVYNGASVSSVNYSSDQSIDIYKSTGNSFSGLKIPLIEIYENSAAEIIDAELTSVDLYSSSTLLLKDSKINGSSSYFVSIYTDSSAVFDNVEITGNDTDGSIGVFSNSSFDMKNSKVSVYYGFQVFSSSSLVVNDSTIECENDCISVYSESKAILTKIKVKGAQDAGIIAFSNTAPNGVTITNSEITGNKDGFIVWETPFSAHRNSIHDNVENGATTYSSDPPATNLDFTSNYWGDKSGPTHTSNPTGLGNIVSNDILFTPFLKYDPTKNTRHPVILIPGITGTYLNRNYGDKDEIWPDILKLISPLDPFDSYLNDLALNIDGTEKSEFPIVPGDIIRGISGVHVFDKLIEEFTNAGYIEGTDLFVFPYDWRLSTKSTADLLKIKIDKILLDTGQDKVDIVAHSMGGLVAKKYIADTDNGKDKVDQLIFLGTPQLGAPKAFKVLMNGDDMSYNLLLLLGLNESRAKYISQNMPSVYELLPSLKYVTENGSYITNALSEIIIPGTSFNLDYLETKDLMIKNGRNPLMFPFTEDLHDSIDDLDLSDMKSYNFVGCGSPTISKITMSQKRSWKKLFLGLVDDYYLKYGDGDETVPLNSSTRTIGSDIYYAVGVSHGSLPAADSVIKGILNILNGEGLNFGDVLKDDSSSCGIEGKVVSTHSPVELHVYDEKGNHTGLKGDGSIEYGIEGVSFDIIEGENYMFLPNDRNFKIVTKATDTGGYNFKIEEQDKNDNITDTYKWNLIPLSTLQTTGEIWVGPDYSPADYAVKIDKDGDGAIDSNYDVAYDGTSNAEKIISESLNKNHSSGYIRLLPYQNINTVEPEQIVNKSDEIVEKQAEVSNFKPESTKEKVIVKNEIKEDKKFEIKEDEKYENNNLASVASTNVKISKNTLLIIIGGFIFVILLAIKFIFKLK